MFSSYYRSPLEYKNPMATYKLPWDEFAYLSHLRGTTHVRKALLSALVRAFNAAQASA